MQVTLNQQDILKAVKSYLNKIMSVPVDVINLDIKGMRTTEGYMATVDVVLDGEEYVPVRPAQSVISVKADEPQLTEHFNNMPELSKQDQQDLIKILELIAINPHGKNDAEILLLSEEASPEVQIHLHENKAYMEVLDRIYSDKGFSVKDPKENTEEEKPESEVFMDKFVNEVKDVKQDEPEVEPEEESKEEQLDLFTDTEEPKQEPVKRKVQTGVNFMGEPVYEELTEEEIQQRGININEPELKQKIRKGLFD